MKNLFLKNKEWAKRSKGKSRVFQFQESIMRKIFVSKEGFVERAEVVRSSGHQMLDRSALKSVEKWQFHPAQQFGVSVNSVLEIPFVFRLDDV